MLTRCLFTPSRFLPFALVLVLALAVVFALYFMSGPARADPDIPPSSNTALLEPSSHVVEAVTTDVEFTTVEVMPLRVAATQVASSTAATATSNWPYAGIGIGIAILGAIVAVAFLRKKGRYPTFPPSFLLLMALLIAVSFPLVSQAQTLSVTEWESPVVWPHTTADAIDSAGRVWFGSTYTGTPRANKVSYLDPASNEVKTWLLPYDSWIPHHVTVGSSNKVWFLEGRPARAVGQLDYESNFLTVWSTPSRPMFLTVDAAGTAWFSEPAVNKLARLNPATNVITEYALPTPNSEPYGVQADSSGNIWFVERLGNNIGKLDPATGVVTEWPIPTTGSGPRGLRVASGQIYFTENARKIGRLNPATNEITEWSVSLIGQIPTGITVDSAGNVWFTSSVVGKLAADNVLTWWTKWTNLIGSPAADAAGNIYVAGTYVTSIIVKLRD